MGCCGGKLKPQDDVSTTNPVAKNPDADPKLATLSRKSMGGGLGSAATPVDVGPDTSDIDTATNRAVKIAKKSEFARERAGEQKNKMSSTMQKAKLTY